MKKIKKITVKNPNYTACSFSNFISKFSVRVVYPDGDESETLASTNTNYLLSVTACLLEDYLPSKAIKKYQRPKIVYEEIEEKKIIPNRKNLR